MDPAVATTFEVALEQGAEELFILAAKVGVPTGVLAVLALLVIGTSLWGMRRKLKVERGPEPISDGQTAEDRGRPPARPGAGGPRVLSDGGASEDLFATPNPYDITDPLRPIPRPTREEGNSEGSG